MPGWSSTVDGRAVGINRTDGLFQMIRVPAGTHRVRFGYAPPNIAWGLAGLIAGCLSVLPGGRLGVGVRSLRRA